MFYKPTLSGAGRTLDYRGSVVSKNDRDLLNLKNSIAKHNEEIRRYTRKQGRMINTNYGHFRLQRVVLMARGPRRINGERIHHNCDSCLHHEHAVYFDVYVGTDSHNQHELSREMELGMTPGQLKKYDDAMAVVNKMKMEGFIAKQRKLN